MTKEEFKDLQLNMQQSGMSVTKYLQHVGINYNTYNYWRKKLQESDSPKPELAPISFTQHADPVFPGSVPTGATLLFPNGLRAHFGSGTESVLMELLTKSLTDHVLPEWYDALLPVPWEDGHAKGHQLSLRRGAWEDEEWRA